MNRYASRPRSALDSMRRSMSQGIDPTARRLQPTAAPKI